MQTVAAAKAASHPLDPLSKEEIEAASRILKRDQVLKESARFVYVTLKEPAKQAVLDLKPGSTLDREVAIVIRERDERKT